MLFLAGVGLTSQLFVIPAQLFLLIHDGRDSRHGEQDRIREPVVREDVFEVVLLQLGELGKVGNKGCGIGRHG